jgi:hypothetical protein
MTFFHYLHWVYFHPSYVATLFLLHRLQYRFHHPFPLHYFQQLILHPPTFINDAIFLPGSPFILPIFAYLDFLASKLFALTLEQVAVLAMTKQTSLHSPHPLPLS